MAATRTVIGRLASVFSDMFLITVEITDGAGNMEQVDKKAQ